MEVEIWVNTCPIKSSKTVPPSEHPTEKHSFGSVFLLLMLRVRRVYRHSSYRIRKGCLTFCDWKETKCQTTHTGRVTTETPVAGPELDMYINILFYIDRSRHMMCWVFIHISEVFVMELYLTDLSNPLYFLGKTLPTLYQARVFPYDEPLLYGGMFDKNLFSNFVGQFNCISINSGLPSNDYGQTVQLSRVEALKLDEMEWGEVPQHLISKGLPLKPDEVSGRYGYQKKEDARAHTLTVEEFFFFEFQAGYHPETFSKLIASLSALRHLSSILHTLDEFKVVLVKNGVYVKLRARIDDSQKPAFAMNS